MTILLLAGTGDAKRIASKLAAENLKAIASLAGATRSPDLLEIPTRVGGFGGEQGFREYLISVGITAVIDATHPFAHRITQRTARVCADVGLPYLNYVRPAWVAQHGDNWIEIEQEQDAAQHVQAGQTVFLATGRQTLDRFSNLVGCRVICRQIDPQDRPFPFAGGEYLIGRPPFSVKAETDLFRALGVDWLIVKNAGGNASATKLSAARDLGIPVLMIQRPKSPNAPIVSNVDDVMAWVRAL